MLKILGTTRLSFGSMQPPKKYMNSKDRYSNQITISKLPTNRSVNCSNRGTFLKRMNLEQCSKAFPTKSKKTSNKLTISIRSLPKVIKH
jgi:hypothetical protein